MNMPDLYSKFNRTQRIINLKYLKEYAERINWKDEGDSAIDVGCGDGSVSVLVRNYKPNMNFFYKKFVCCDINKNMVQFAQEQYRDEDITFRVLDITEDLPDDLKGGFNHVFSFYTLHWVKAQEKAFRNIYNLLTDDGDIFINFFASNTIFNMYKVLADQPKWSTWLKHVDIFISPYQDMENPEKVVAEILKNLGFKKVKVKDVQCKYLTSCTFTIQEFKHMIKSVEPFNMPQEILDELIEDGFLLPKELGIFNFNNDSVSYDYKLLVLKANK